MDRIRELSDASVPFNFDVHALFFSKECGRHRNCMRDRLANVRVNIVNRRREFFRVTRWKSRHIWLSLLANYCSSMKFRSN